MTKVLVVHGPNLNLLGTREPELYGYTTLDVLNEQLSQLANDLDISIECFQSNAEHILIDRIQLAKEKNVKYLIINPAALAHTSIALRDALTAINVPFVEVHISNVYAREPFRHFSYLSDKAVAVISGLGLEGYFAALRFAQQSLTPR